MRTGFYRRTEEVDESLFAFTEKLHTMNRDICFLLHSRQPSRFQSEFLRLMNTYSRGSRPFSSRGRFPSAKWNDVESFSSVSTLTLFLSMTLAEMILATSQGVLDVKHGITATGRNKPQREHSHRHAVSPVFIGSFISPKLGVCFSPKEPSSLSRQELIRVSRGRRLNIAAIREHRGNQNLYLVPFCPQPPKPFFENW